MIVEAVLESFGSVRYSQLTIVWWNIGHILRSLHQPAEVSALSGRYARFLLIGLIPYYGFESLRRFLQAQGITRAMLYVSIITSLLHPVANYLYIYKLGLGYDGAPLSVVTSQWVMFVVLLGYTVIVKPHTPGTWPGFSREAFSEMGQYFKLAVPGGER